MTHIFLKKVASKKNLTYHIVVSHAPAGGKFIEKLGFYRPLQDCWKTKHIAVNIDRLNYWLIRGARMSILIYSILRPLLFFHKKSKI